MSDLLIKAHSALRPLFSFLPESTKALARSIYRMKFW